MPLVVFLRGVNVGGHRTLRPTTIAEQLKHLDAVNIGAAGTFVVRRPVTQAHLRAELARRLPFDAEITAAKERADQAKAEYEHLRETAGERKANIKAKIEALKA